MSVARKALLGVVGVVIGIATLYALPLVQSTSAETGTCTTTTTPGYWAAWSGPNCNIIDPNTNLYTCGAVTGAMWISPTSTTYCTNSYCGLPSRTYQTPITTCFYTEWCFPGNGYWWGGPVYNCFQIPSCSTKTYDTTEWYNCTGTSCEKCTSTPYAYCNYDPYGTYFCESQPRYRTSCSPTSATPTTCSPVSLICPDGYVAKCAPSCTGSGCGTCTPSCTGHTCAANIGQTCYSSTNACGYKSVSQIRCDGSCPALTPLNPPGYGNACQSSANACGQTQANGTLQCNGSCSSTPPPNPAGYGTSCSSAPNICGQTQANGTLQCNGSCSSTPPPLPGTYNANCSSCNNVGQCNAGTITCGGSCSAAAPANNYAPGASNPGATQGTSATYCSTSYPPVFLSWTYSDPEGTSQSAYQIQMSTNPSFSPIVLDTGKVASSSVSYAPTNLSYATGYSWRVRVWDSSNLASSFVSGPFLTTKAKHPTANFSWSPQNPSLGSPVAFNDASVAYGGSSISQRAWTFEQGSPSSSSAQNPMVVFSGNGANGLNAVSLSATDSNGNSCSATNNLQLLPSDPFPDWDEIAPF